MGHLYAHSQSCDCPPVAQCGACQGGITSLTLRYDGLLGLGATITADDDGPGVLFSGWVDSGSTFTITGSNPDETFNGDEVNLTGLLINATINTSCGTPVYVNSTYGNFTVVAGESKDGGPVCCAPTDMETTPPVISNCPADIQLAVVPSGCSTVVSWTAPTATDNCGSVILTSTHNPGDTFAKGSTSVVYTATDDYGNTSTCSFNVIVDDDTDPVIAGCPASDIIVNADGACEAIVSWTIPTASDNCGPVTLASPNNPGDVFPLGTTIVTYTATDDSGNTATCVFNVIVIDNTNPAIAGCPAADIVVTANASCEATVGWPAPTASDNCGTVTLTSSKSPGDVFLGGTTLVTYTATDGAGNTSTCTFNVIVNDDTDPVITGCPSSDIVAIADASCEAIVSWTVPTASDNCGPLTLTSSKNPGDVFLVGTTPVTYTATDGAGNISTCTFNVIVNDDTDPVITGCPGADIIVNANASCQATVSWTAPAVADNCGPVTLTSSKNPGDVFLLGTTIVTYTAMDGVGNTTTCTFRVIVNDETDPVITGCPVSDIVAVANAGCQANVSWIVPVATDNCGTVTFTSSKNPGDVFLLGTTVVTYTATDAAGNISTCTFNVIVNDNTDPVITGCPSDIIVSANGSCEAVVNWTAPTINDNCGSVAITTNHNPGEIFPLGTTVVLYTATDGGGNISTCSFNVVVNDDTDPVITGCITSDIIVATNGACQGTATWIRPTATDNCGAATLTASHSPGNFALGTTQVTYTATDGFGNTSTCSFNVVVQDVTNPVVSGCGSSDIIVSANAMCQATASWTPPTATDNCGSVTMTSSHAPGSLFLLGTTTVTYTATDGSGNTSTCNFNVIVKDETDPVLSGCPATDIVVDANASCLAIVFWNPPTATDHCGAATLTSTHSPGTSFALGTTLVSYTATDDAGNTSTCSFNVSVVDHTGPVVSGCPTSDIIVSSNSCQSIVNWTTPSASDNCGTVVLTSSHNPGETFPVGTTAVTYTASDASGNTSACTFNVIVTDTTDPVISGCVSSDIIAVADGTCKVAVNWVAPLASDDCDAVTLVSSHDPGDLFDLGTTVVTYTATDGYGNTATCSFNVIVKDETSPMLSGCSDVIAIASGSCETSVTWTPPNVTDCQPVSLIGSHNPGDLFSPGTTEVTYTATDNNGNTSFCKFNVIVEDKTSPVFLNCPEEIVILVDNGCDAIVSWVEPTAADNCGGVTMTKSHASGDSFSTGTTTVRYTATDTYGNVSICQFNVTVNMEMLPIIANCPVEINVNGNEYDEASVDWTPPTGTSACGEVVLTSTHQPGDVFSLGTTAVEYKFEGTFGNISYCRFNVVVTHQEIDIDISKVVTPDGNGVNDEWIVTNIEKFNDNKVVIVDRWGSVIYSASGYNNVNVVWKGVNRNGGTVPTGTYFYTISVRYGPSVFEKSGFIELIR